MKINDLQDLSDVSLDYLLSLSPDSSYFFLDNYSYEDLKQLQKRMESVDGIDKYDLELSLDLLLSFKSPNRRDNKKKDEKINVSGIIFYRGVSLDLERTKDLAASKRSGYAVFVTTNINQAASYAGKDGHIVAMTFNVKEADLYSPSNNHHSFVEFDDKSIKLMAGQVLVALGVYDSGPYKNELKSSNLKADMNASFTDPNVVSIKSISPAKKYFT